MIGKNILTFNQATMMEAVQVYLDRTMIRIPKVLAVCQEGDAFQIVVEGGKPESEDESRG